MSKRENTFLHCSQVWDESDVWTDIICLFRSWRLPQDTLHSLHWYLSFIWLWTFLLWSLKFRLVEKTLSHVLHLKWSSECVSKCLSIFATTFPQTLHKEDWVWSVFSWRSSFSGRMVTVCKFRWCFRRLSFELNFLEHTIHIFSLMWVFKCSFNFALFL